MRTSNIPAIIHQTWKTKSIPPAYQKAVDSFKIQNPDVEYKLWTDEDLYNLAKDFFPQFLPLFERYPEQIQRVDIARYMILYQFGGLYSDIDIVCQKPLRSLFNHTVVLPETARSRSEKIYLSNDFMLSAPQHPFFKFVLEGAEHAYKRWHWPWIPHHFRILLTTGSLFLTHRYHAYVDKKEIYILPPALYGKDETNRLVDHIPGNSWVKMDSYFFFWISRTFKKLRIKC